ncbi:CRISPR-associated protein Cas2 [Psychromicrobium silvestre]|uniref:CRISPR-associated protein Cas2 n=2 Tax=Psychromicrobium silvestre TaxID=1645614 RepID=A0A7Y9LUB3_9MICC|nr:CRISPR-associated protein Cas2 [Psychromicrobium silvestre]
MLELSAGVFVGHVSKRVRDLMWEKCVLMIGSGRAIMVFSARNEQRMDFKVHGHHWSPIDVDGITLLLRPSAGEGPVGNPSSRAGWSKAAQRRKYGGGKSL